MNMSWYQKYDHALIQFAKQASPWMQRISLAITYAWFGGLKVISLSPAAPMVKLQLHALLPFMAEQPFLIALGLYEVLIGVLILFRKADRFTLLLLFAHLIMILVPMLVLPDVIWQRAFVPTLEGQYVIKNVLIAALALTIAAQLRPERVSSERTHRL